MDQWRHYVPSRSLWRPAGGRRNWFIRSRHCFYSSQRCLSLRCTYPRSWRIESRCVIVVVKTGYEFDISPDNYYKPPLISYQSYSLQMKLAFNNDSKSDWGYMENKCGPPSLRDTVRQRHCVSSCVAFCKRQRRLWVVNDVGVVGYWTWA